MESRPEHHKTPVQPRDAAEHLHGGLGRRQVVQPNSSFARELDLQSVAVQLNASPVQTTILVPAYNEEEALPHVLEAIFAVIDESYEVLVVNDGSKDRTAEVAQAYPCRLISHTVNSGKGAAMLTGIRYANGEKIIFIDADATYPADAIPDVVRKLDDCDMVRCVRSLGRDNIPAVNRLGNQIFDAIIKGFHRVEGDDMLSGLYGLRRRHLRAMRLNSQGFDIESEIMIKARAMGLSGGAIPISYNERIGEKKLKPVRDGIVILMRVLGLALHYNPFAAYIVPGLLLWAISALGIFALSTGPLITPFAGFSTHTLIASVMAFLAGFQLVVFGCVVNLYATETGLGKSSQKLRNLAMHFPRAGGAVLGVALCAIGLAWVALIGLSWTGGGFGAFYQTEALVIAMSLVVWGIQLLSAMLFLSLFAGSTRFSEAWQPSILQPE